MFGLNLTQLGISAVIGGVCVVGLFLAGDHYGSNAHWRANREAEDKAKNAAIEYLNQHENQIGAEEDKRLLDNDRHFTEVAPSLGQCVLTSEQVDALNTTGN